MARNSLDLSSYSLPTTLLLLHLTFLQAVRSSDYQRPLVASGTGINLGTIDDFGSRDERIVVSQPIESISFDDEYYYLQNMGLKNWGLIQLSMAMHTYPNSKDFKLRSPFCSISEETTSYYLKSEFINDNSTFIYDYELAGDTLFVMNSQAHILAVKVSAKQNTDIFGTSTSSITPLWRQAGLERLSIAKLNEPFNEAGLAYHKSSKILYIPTNIALFAADTSSGIDSALSIVGSGVYLPHSFISYCDVVGDYMFVAYAFKGIFVYNIANKNNIKLIGKMDEAFFGRPANFRINDFSIQDHSIEILTNDKQSLLRNPLKDTFFTAANYSLADRNQYIEKSRWKHRLMFVAEKSAIHVVDIESILTSGTMPSSPFTHKIPVSEVVAMSRFHDTLYTLSTDWSEIDNDEFTTKSTAHEIFLFDYSLDKWASETTSAKDLFTINRQLPFNSVMENIYSDENFFYVVGNSTSYVYERGVPRGFQFSNERVGKKLYDPNIFAINKFIIDGMDYVLAVTPSKISDFSVVISDPHIRCPDSFGLKNSYGTYEMQINATTRNCPARQIAESTLAYDNASGDRKLCLWTKTIRVEYFAAGLIDKKGGASILLTLLIIVLCLAITFITWCYRRNKKMHEQYEQLKREIGTIRGGAAEEQKFYGQEGASGQDSALKQGAKGAGRSAEFELKKSKEEADQEEGHVDYTEEA